MKKSEHTEQPTDVPAEGGVEIQQKKEHKGGRSKQTLTEKEQNFVNEYLICLNATQAYLKAGYPVKNDAVAGQMGFRLLQKVKIQQQIQKQREMLQNKYDVTQERIIREYARIAFLDVSKLYDENGHFKNIHDIDEDTRAAIGGVEVERLFENREHIGTLHKVKLIDKRAALSDLATHLGMFKVVHEVTGKIQHELTAFEFLANALTKDGNMQKTLGTLLEKNKIQLSEKEEVPIEVPTNGNGTNGNGAKEH